MKTRPIKKWTSPGVDFIKQFTPYALNLCYASFLNKFTPIWHHAFAPCAQLLAFYPRFWVRSTLYALRPTFLKSTPGLFLDSHRTTYFIWGSFCLRLHGSTVNV
jgi:hypothetical protein